MDGHSSNLIGEGGKSTNRTTFDRNLGLCLGVVGSCRNNHRVVHRERKLTHFVLLFYCHCYYYSALAEVEAWDEAELRLPCLVRRLVRLLVKPVLRQLPLLSTHPPPLRCSNNPVVEVACFQESGPPLLKVWPLGLVPPLPTAPWALPRKP